jgi:membrane protease YdiL (CAAX protease family)
MLLNAVLSTLLNLTLLAGLPFLAYAWWQKRRHQRPFAESARRAGLTVGDAGYLGYCLGTALILVLALVLLRPPVEPFVRPGSPQRVFAGLGLRWPAVPLALLYGVLKTGFAEELLFRGLITGSLARRLRVRWANVVQSLVFLLPHLLVLRLMPEMWGIIPLVLAGALFTGWVRIRSGSLLGPWLIHGAANVTMCLSVAVRTAV